MTLNMDAVFSKLGQATDKLESDLSSHVKTMDSAKPGDLLKMQQMMQKWTMATQLQSNTLKSLGDCMKSTIQNMR
jgi:type III secretion protein F